MLDNLIITIFYLKASISCDHGCTILMAQVIKTLTFFFTCRYLALEGMCLLATSEFSHDTVKKHMETVITALKVYHTLSFEQFKQCVVKYSQSYNVMTS